ncbi:hypothetical protein [Pseudobacteriovorax antillogorgiicola]|uniref:Uncharacterized protein n=1 Tax=Pseudobacteriovorax antillogorgiicola TaxID=1513793 RepID=A0A1Y6CID6_9BACT|nr:hypothetical protein [Pseudobacteriovorax antillogorgiicola]TCS48254.1 hypothetical protein EDD56_11834 [Pseudobacteriovorax antillogorgiicola]SMF57206.1 hypothetical protein SAMN06296036_118107 [Pseudobacteriovorax antillogorgiicola]
MKFFAGISFIFLCSCVHLSYPQYADLMEGESVNVLENIADQCVYQGLVHGTIRNSDLEFAVENAFRMARNEATSIGADTILYSDTLYQPAMGDHAVAIEFESYRCGQTEANPLHVSQTQALASGEAQRQKLQAEATARAVHAAHQAAMLSAQQAAQQAAMQAAQQAAMQAAQQAAQASTMHMHHP